MDELPKAEGYDVANHVKGDQVPDDTITIIIRSGGRTFAQGRKLPETQEQTVAVMEHMSQLAIDTIDLKGIKAGGTKFKPEQ